MTFQENVGQGIGSLLIDGLAISHNGYDPLGKIWASARKRIREQWHVDVVGLFTYDDGKKVVSCSFCLNYYVTEMKNIDERVYTTRYIDSFPYQMTFFQDIILAFVDDQENGLEAYEKLFATRPGKRALDQLLNRFLRSINVRTETEQKRSDRRHAKTEKTDK